MAVGIFIITKFAALVESNDDGYTQVMQSWWDGNMSARFQPGVYYQGLARVWTFRKEDTYTFSNDPKEEEEVDTPGCPILFNDGGRGILWGSVRYTFPTDERSMVLIVRHFMDETNNPAQKFFEEAVQEVVKQAIYVVGCLLSTTDSYTTHQAQLSQMAQDQINDGIYRTIEVEVTTTDPVTGAVVVENVARIMRDSLGQPMRDPAFFDQYGVVLSQFAVSKIDYDLEINNQIQESMDYQNRIQGAQADAKTANTQRLTNRDNGEREVTKARYEEEQKRIQAIALVRKDSTKVIIDAQRDLEVAKRDRDAVRDQVAGKVALRRGQAEAAKKILASDGALVRKKLAYERVLAYWGDAVRKLDLVPEISVANNAGGEVTPPSYILLQLIDTQVCRELGLSFEFPR